jgi:cytochrome c553
MFTIARSGHVGRLLACASLLGVGWASAQVAGTKLQFQRDVAPILQQSCGQCHISASMGKLRLDSEASLLRGGVSGPAILPGHSAESLLVKRVLGLTDAPRMPMGAEPLSSAQVQLIRKWIDEGRFETNAAQASQTAPSLATSAPSPLFAKEVRPILAARCYQCHGPEVQQNGLRLDSLAALLKGGAYGPVVVPHKSGESRVIRRLLAQERPQMPYGGPPLSPAEIESIRKWIDAGAPGPDDATPLAQTQPLKHWAYVKPVRPNIPKVKDAAWCRNPIDNFVLAKLEQQGLKPSEEADRPMLIRRLYLDLTGLPPSPQEVDAFVNDRRRDAYERTVDRLLASPHYGEHWARQWLDLARYADSNGYEKDQRRTAWGYRDWVIRALNADMSFRDFTVDQIAGDMLPNPTKDQLIATGFHRNSMLNQEGGIDVNEYYYYTQVDRVNTTASVWLGSTLGCAQCHNHKFDPFTHKDYYRFLAFFNQGEHHVGGEDDHWMQEPELELPNREQEAKSKQLRDEIATLETKLKTQTPELDSAQAGWETAMRNAGKDWTMLKPSEYKSAGGARLTVLPDSSILATGTNPQADTYVIEAKTSASAITGVRLEVLPDPSLPHGGPGRDAAGNFFLSDFNVEIAPANNLEAARPVVWKSAVADESQDEYSIKNAVQKKPGRLAGWAIDENDPKPVARQAVFLPGTPIDNTAGNVLIITLKHQMRHASRNIGRFRMSVTSIAEPSFIAKIPATVRPLLDVPDAQRSQEQKEKLAAAYRAVSPLLDPTRKQIVSLKEQVDKLGIVTAMVMREQPAFVRPSAYIRERGTFTSPGDLVYADVPGALNPLPKNSMPNRLGLAEWLVSDDNPLTARVAVNHFWEALFGQGIVETSEDFGTQGDPPSHPELLDWLATEFMRDNWSMKKIQRLIVTSATYRQDSRATPELQARDPYNKLYARGPRFRIDAESVHDIALAASGLLSDKMYGPPVFPYQPQGVWDIPYSDEKWVESTGEDRYRRAIYTFMRRSAPYPSLATYDAPSRELCTVRRVRTNTPLQALTSLNDPFFFMAARALAKRIVDEGGSSVTDRVTYGFRLTVSRRPSQKELDRLVNFYRQQLSEYSKDANSAYKTIGTKQGAAAADGAELAAWSMVANVLLNTDEAISKE